MLVTILLFLLVPAMSQQMTVATYNLRYDSRDDSIAGNGWRQRCPVIAQLIQFYNWDIFGTQEVRANQLHDLSDSLNHYAHIGVGRDDGKAGGEFAAIFYKKEKYEVLEKGNFWLSPVTNKPNTGWDAALPRICTWGKFREVPTGFVFYFFNLHMDHIGVVARRESARLVLDTIRKMKGAVPVILTGDFNVDQHNESYTLLHHSGILQDAYEKAPIKWATNGTFNGFNIQRYTDSRIDHIFLSDTFSVLRYGILTDTYWTPQPSGLPEEGTPRLPSDHYPVMAILSYGTK